MKLISIHIDDFGCLHNYDYEFEDGLNVVLHDNGWGKTTMGVFLKVMLYGFDSKRSKDITENERRRYFPWQGGKYGGTLDFEAGGVRYRIFRTFGETPRFDKTKILNINSKTTANIDSEKIGESLFRLDVNAFQRSVFINQNGLFLDGAASSIHTRLNALVSQANDVAAFDDAIAKLTTETKIYEKTGARGQIGDITRQITALERQRDQLESDIVDQDDARKRILEIDTLLRTLDDDLAEKKKRLYEITGEAKKREASRELLENLNKQIVELQEKMDAIKSDLGGRIPSIDEIEHVKHQKQSAAVLAQQLAKLEQGYTELEVGYSDLLENYNGILPTTEHLDEIQSIYGRLQGIRSAEVEVAEAIGEEPEGYTLIKAVADKVPDYIGRLHSIIDTQKMVQQHIHELETGESDLKRERDFWADKKKRYTTLTKEVTHLQDEAGKEEMYSPNVIGPVISDMESLQKRQRTLTQQITNQDIAIRQEADGWDKKKYQYASLKDEVERLQLEANKKSEYASEKVMPAIMRLETLQRQQQLVDVKSEELLGDALTANQEALLARYPGDLPDIAEGNKVLNKVRGIAQKVSDVQGLEARKAGEQSKADSLRVSVSQLNEFPNQDTEIVEEPKKSSGTAMIGTGVAVSVLGAVLFFAIAPVMAAVSVLGTVLIILGVINNNSYKIKLKAYESSKVSSAQKKDGQKKKAELQAQLDMAKESVASIQEQIDSLNRDIQMDQVSVDSWATKWLSGGKVDEASISEVIDQIEQIAKLRKRKQDIFGKERFVTEETEYIITERKNIEVLFPEIAEKNIADALDFLRSSETDYKLFIGRLQTAQKNLNKFFSESGFTADQLSAAESPRIVEMKSEQEGASQELEEVASQRKVYEDTYPEIVGVSYDDALKILRSKEGNYKVIDGQLQAAIRNRKEFLIDEKLSEEQLLAEESPRMVNLADTKKRVSEKLAQMIEDANEVLTPLERDTDSAHIVQALHEVEQMFNEYQQYVDKLRERAKRQVKKQGQIDELQKKLEDRLAVLQGRYLDMEIPDRLTLIREEVGSAVKCKERMMESKTEQERKKEELEDVNKLITMFTSAFGQFVPKTEDILAEIYEKASSYLELAAAKEQLEKQKISVNLAQTTSDGAEETELRTEITHLEERRDILREEYTHKSDFIRQTDQSLEKYPDVVQEIHQLYDQKQKAQNTLVMLKRTIQLITKAKENLANRYLNKVEKLFNSYMHIWLNNDAVRGILDIDFNVTIEENAKIHVAEGYSTGYCDLIDFCMRLALVDTLFESEQPFLILDDPFINLDVDRLDKALELLNVMAVDKQIVYFVCHPIRAAKTNENSGTRAEFVCLAEAARKTIENRKSTGIKRKKIVRKSPKEMYQVVNSDGMAAIKPVEVNYTITNNIFSMGFVLSDSEILKDHSYELFFIDAIGHVLNDRQLIEIKNGKLSTERVQFCLNTRDDSGDQYELMIRETGQTDYEVVARIPFKVKLAFAGTFSFEL